MSTITVVIAGMDTKLGLATGGAPTGNDSRVLVAVVKVGPVRMRVYELFAAMPVGVAGGGRETRMCMEVMPAVVPVVVQVLDRPGGRGRARAGSGRPAPTTPTTPSQPIRPRCSRKSATPSTAVGDHLEVEEKGGRILRA